MTKAWHQNFKRKPKETRTSRDGITFDSVGEMQYYEKLKLWQLAGDVRNIRLQVKFPLVKDQIEVLTDTGKIASYTADFVYERRVYRPLEVELKPENIDLLINPPIIRTDEWVRVVADYKGYSARLEMFRIRVFEALYGIKVTIAK